MSKPQDLTRSTSDSGAEAEHPRVVVAEDEALIRLDLVELLEEHGYEIVGQASDGEEAVRLANELEDRICAVVMLTAFSQRDLIKRAKEAGAMAYVVKPFDASDVIPAIEIAMARFAEIRGVEDEVMDLEERLESRKIVDQAKGILQTSLDLTEPEAFRWIQKTAMDLRKSMREVAQGVIDHAESEK